MTLLREANAPLTVREIAGRVGVRLAMPVAAACAVQKNVGKVRNALARTRSGTASEEVDGLLLRRAECNIT